MGLKVALNGSKFLHPVAATPQALRSQEKVRAVSSLSARNSGGNPALAFKFKIAHKSGPFAFHKLSRNGRPKLVLGASSSEESSLSESSNGAEGLALSANNVSVYGDDDEGFHDLAETSCAVEANVSTNSRHSGVKYVREKGFLRPSSHLRKDFLEPSLLGIRPRPPDWPERNDIIKINIEIKAKSVEIPLSLRMIKRKQQQETQAIESETYECSSIHRAFSSMVFIIREIQSYALHVTASLYREDLGEIVNKAHREINASFVWIFKQVFSQAPTLMVDVMMLSTNFSAHAVVHNVPNMRSETFWETLGMIEDKTRENSKYSSTSRAIRGNGQLDDFVALENQPGTIPGENSGIPPLWDDTLNVEEARLWSSMRDEAANMESSLSSGEVLDFEALNKLVSALYVEVETDDYEEYSRTDLLYQLNLSQDPYNPLLLSNYAQFLCLINLDYRRAEECFKRAVQVEPPDAESLSRYADFLWVVKKDMWGAEERYQQAIAAEPENPYYASKYASFLWNSGGEETCFPLDSSDDRPRFPEADDDAPS